RLRHSGRDSGHTYQCTACVRLPGPLPRYTGLYSGGWIETVPQVFAPAGQAHNSSNSRRSKISLAYETCSIEPESDEIVSNRNCNQLLAPAEERDWAGEDAVTPVEVPKLLAGARIQGIEVSAGRGRKDQVPASRQHSGPGR